MRIRIHVRSSDGTAKGSAGRTAAVWALRSAELFFWTAGLVLLVGSLGFFLYSRFYQAIEAERFDSQLALNSPGTRAAIPVARLAIQRGSPFGRVQIARLGLSAMVVEGVEPGALRVAAGHIPFTALPGETGNVGIAGHRDSFFRELRKIRTDDLVELTTLHGHFQYQVESTEIVAPTQVEVLAPTARPELTLVTCYPFNFIGAAPKRFIVHARLKRN